MAEDQQSLDRLNHGDEAYEILKRLPVKNLCRMSKVSSTWKNLIENAYFKTLYHAWSKKNPLLLFVTPPQIVQNYITSDEEYEQLAEEFYEDFGVVDEDDIQYPLLLTLLKPTDGDVIYQVTIQTCADFEVLSSGRGCLFCIRSTSVNYIIFNATTKEIQTLPEADPPYANAVGFGYIESKDAYAVVILYYGSCQVLMLSETGEVMTPWRTIQEKSPFNVSGNTGTMIGDTCYWMNDKRFRSSMTMRILCLDIDSEMFYSIDYPSPESYENGHDMHMGELNNELFLTDTFPGTFKMDIWVRRNGKNSNWEIKHRMDLSLIDGFDDVFSELKLIGYVEGDNDQDGVLMFQDSQQTEVLYYNVEAKIFKKGRQLQVGNNRNMIFPYTERLSCIRRSKKTCS